MHQNSLEVFTHFAKPLFEPGMEVLEIGPDEGWRAKAAISDTGVGYRSADANNRDCHPVQMRVDDAIESDADRFDIVFSLSVIEHVRKPWRWLAELTRITKPGGLIVSVSPTSWPYHEAPIDCWRLYPEAYRALFEECGLEEVLVWHGKMAELEEHFREHHGPHWVQDCIGIGRKPVL